MDSLIKVQGRWRESLEGNPSRCSFPWSQSWELQAAVLIPVFQELIRNKASLRNGTQRKKMQHIGSLKVECPLTVTLNCYSQKCLQAFWKWTFTWWPVSILPVLLKLPFWAFLVVQWLRIRLPMQGTWIWSLFWEDPTVHKVTEPKHRNYWAWVPNCCSLCSLEPMLCNKRSHCSERSGHCN